LKVDKELQLTVAPSPHLRSPDTVSGAMRDVIIALLPVTLVSIYWYKWHAIFLVLVCLAAAALTEILFRKVMKKPVYLKRRQCHGHRVAGSPLLWPGYCLVDGRPGHFYRHRRGQGAHGRPGLEPVQPGSFGRLSVILIVPLFQYVTAAFTGMRPFIGTIDVATQATPWP